MKLPGLLEDSGNREVPDQERRASSVVREQQEAARRPAFLVEGTPRSSGAVQKGEARKWVDSGKRPPPSFLGLRKLFGRQNKVPLSASLPAAAYQATAPTPGASRFWCFSGAQGAFCRTGLQDVATSASLGPKGPGKFRSTKLSRGKTLQMGKEKRTSELALRHQPAQSSIL